MAFAHFLQTTITLLIVLSILVVAHEWGHFIVARIFGIRVDDFSIGFGKRIIRLGKRGDTEYNIRMLPLGGFVKIAGMAADEEPLVRAKDKVLGKETSGDPDSNSMPLIAENIETDSLDHVPAPDEFGSKPLWQRSLVILAGPVMSFVLGYVVFCLIGVTIGWPSGTLSNRIDQVEPGGEGQAIGLHSGDAITAIDGVPIKDGHQMVTTIQHSVGKTLTLTVSYGGQSRTLTAKPRALKDASNQPVTIIDVTTPGAFGTAFKLQPGDALQQIGDTQIKSPEQAQQILQQNSGKPLTLGVVRDLQGISLDGIVPPTAALTSLELTSRQAGVLQILPEISLKRTGLSESIKDGNNALVSLFRTLGELIHQKKLQESTGGIIMMYQATGLAVQDNALKPSSIYKTISLMGQLSLSLAIFNLLPIPILDGGHLLSFFIEWVRRGKKMTEQQQQGYLMTGLAIILILFVLIMTKDILRTVNHQLPQ